MSETSILSHVDQGILTLTFNRPQRKNALTPAMYTELVERLRAADQDPEVRVIVVTGSADAFTSGNDLGDFMNTPPAGADSPVFQLLLTLVDLEKPLIAAVNGVAVGIGVTMLLHCDLVYAADSARFQLPFVNLGLVPEGGSSTMLPAIMGHARAAELLMLGEKFSAQEADRVGLVTRLYPSSELAERVRERALVLAGKPMASIKHAKKLMRDPNREALKETLVREAAIFLERLTSPAAAEAFTAFFEKRAPDFRTVGE
jgi:enoyl-CoA hydratase/carnithine racemase